MILFDHSSQGYDSPRDSVPAVSASLGKPTKHGFVGFTVPLGGPKH